jgi:hypothetical protein
MRELDEIQKEIEAQSERINIIVDGIVDNYAGELDEFVGIIKSVLERVKTGEFDEYPNHALEMQMIKLPVLMYFAGKGLETLGGESDIAEALRKEIYNKIIIGATGTIQEKGAKAEQGALNERLMEAVYSRAYKKLKIQIEMADKIFSALKKIVSKRIQEGEINGRENGWMGVSDNE